MADDLTAQIADLLQDAADQATSPEAAATLRELRARLDGPLRVAIAGRVKAGKSTMLNALVSEELAPTDAGECTQIVTWYVRGDQPRVVLHPHAGQPRNRPFRRSGGALEVDLGGVPAGDVERLVVSWPTQRLREITLIDTPGLASLSADISARTLQALTPQDEQERVAEADAVLYLLRHAHSSDVRFLEAFTEDALVDGAPVNAIGVISRADEMGSSRLDALDTAARIAERYQQDPRLRRICPMVLPVAGLLAYAAATLREDEFRALAEIASAPDDEVVGLLLTADRFAFGLTTTEVTEPARAQLLARLGLFGVRLSVDLIRTGETKTASELAEELGRRSGLDQLRKVLVTQFAERARVLKARTALSSLEAVLASGGCQDPDRLRGRTEMILAGAHAFAEVRLLDLLRSGALDLPEERTAELDRLLGGNGHDAGTRLGLQSPTPEQLRQAAVESLESWQRLAEHPWSSRQVQESARTARRTLEGILAGLAPDPVR
ncbi:dynamin family protein [Angustibacter sp. McL0619]|uniref:dynamin family protein n=1 Tax=Angustibacter sp. McL0619 TaxID=3415676 RepID=UPI003CF8ED9C